MSANETMEIDERYFSYEKFLWILLDEACQHKLEYQIIGTEVSRRTGINYPLYRLVIHPKNERTICIVSGIHGNEIAGPLCILKITHAIIHDLPEQYRYVIYPMINPSGFDLRQRYDADQRDLNAIFGPTLKSRNYFEVQAFYQDALKFTPFEAIITLHEDSDREYFYMYGLGKENLDYYHAVCAFAKTCIPPWINGEIEGCMTDEHGLILSNARDHAFDGSLFAKGLTKKAFTFETPGKLDCHFRVNMMTQLVLQSVNLMDAMNWMEKNNHFDTPSHMPSSNPYKS
jgi:predicted deacylase